MLQIYTALPLCKVTDSLWNRYVVFKALLVIMEICLLSSCMNSADCGHQAPLLSTAIGTNRWVAARSSYFAVLLMAALSVAVQAEDEVNWIWDAAKVSRTVTSQVSGLPRDHGTRVAPSGLFPYCLDKPIGSLLAGIWASLTALQIRLLNCKWQMMWCALLICQTMKTSVVNSYSTDACMRLAYLGPYAKVSSHT